MKPDGRALDIAVIGLGQAGGNLAAEFFRRGYRALALNTAQTDLASLEPGGVFPSLPQERRLYIGLDGYDGAGADPTYGQDCIHEHADRIRAAVLKQAANADALIITAGLGGGTGSSVSALVEILKDESLPLMALMTLPTEGESGLAKVNAVRAVNEMVDAQLLGWVFADNARIASLNPNVSIVDYYAHINGQIAAPIDALNCLNAREDLTPIRSFDGEDFRKLLLSGGVLNYAVAELPGISIEEVVGTIRDCIEESDIMPAGFDIARISYLGIVIEASESALAESPISVFEDISAQLKAETGGAAVYYGIYRASDERPVTLRLVASTQSLPHRMRQILTDAKREGMALGAKVQEELPTLELGEISDFDLFRTKTRPGPRSQRASAAGKSGRSSAGIIDDMALEIGGGAAATARAATPVPRKATGRKPKAARAKPAPTPPPAPVEPAAPEQPPAASEDETTPQAQEARPSRRRNRPRRRATTTAEAKEQPEPKTEAAVEPPPPPAKKGNDLGTEEIDVVAALAKVDGPMPEIEVEIIDAAPQPSGGPPPVPVEGLASSDLPNPETYDQLVTQFIGAQGTDEKDEVVSRLEQDSASEMTVVRYYAVEAMSKLGRKVFGEALLQATEDENEAIRSLAAEALRR